MHVLASIIIIIPPHIEDASHIQNKNPTGMPVCGQLIPQSRYRISRMRLVVIFNKRHLLQRCQILQVCYVVGKQFRRNWVGQWCQNIGNICYKFVVSQFQLFIFPLLVVLLQHIVFDPLWFLRYRFIVLTLMMCFGQVLLIWFKIGRCLLGMLRSVYQLFRAGSGYRDLCLLEWFEKILIWCVFKTVIIHLLFVLLNWNII